MVEDSGRKGDRQGIDGLYVVTKTNGWKTDVKVWRGEGGGMSDQFLVEARLKLVGAGRMECVRYVLKASELNNIVKESAYQDVECEEGV